MKLSTQLSVIDRIFGPYQAFSTIKKAGFDAVDFWLGEESRLMLQHSALQKYFTDLRKYAEDIGIETGQTHAPFYSVRVHKERHNEILELQKRAIAATAYLGCKYVIIHPLRTDNRIYDIEVEESRELNLEYYSSLIPVLEEFDVYLAVENMFGVDPETKEICPTICTTVEEMIYLIDTLGERFVACLDIGHVNLIKQEGYEHVNIEHMISSLGHRLKTVHVHDNDGINDLHYPPFMGTIDWDTTAKALKDIGYQGTLSLEADNLLSLIQPEKFDKGQDIMYAAAARLRKMILEK